MDVTVGGRGCWGVAGWGCELGLDEFGIYWPYRDSCG